MKFCKHMYAAIIDPRCHQAWRFQDPLSQRHHNLVRFCVIELYVTWRAVLFFVNFILLTYYLFDELIMWWCIILLLKCVCSVWELAHIYVRKMTAYRQTFNFIFSPNLPLCSQPKWPTAVDCTTIYGATSQRYTHGNVLVYWFITVFFQQHPEESLQDSKCTLLF